MSLTRMHSDLGNVCARARAHVNVVVCVYMCVCVCVCMRLCTRMTDCAGVRGHVLNMHD